MKTFLQIELTRDQLDFISSSLNAYWHQASRKLNEKDLGDIERRNYQAQKDEAKKLMERFLKL